jgi:aspartyl protease family protein
VLSPGAARRLGIDPGELQYTRVFRTANGTVRGAPYNLASLKIGSIEFSNVPVTVNQAEMDTSLLGMTFLNRLESFEFRGRQLFLRAQ